MRTTERGTIEFALVRYFGTPQQTIIARADTPQELRDFTRLDPTLCGEFGRDEARIIYTGTDRTGGLPESLLKTLKRPFVKPT